MTVHELRNRRLAMLGARAGVVLSATMLAITGFGLSTGGVPAAGAATIAGAAQVVTPCDQIGGCQPLDEGDSTTPFSLLLPTNASCTGDSANDDFNVTSFMVRDGADLTTVQFDPLGGPLPLGYGDEYRQPLYEVGTGSSYTAKQTAAATEPGGPGPVINIPAFDFASVGFEPGDVGTGRYSIGIACIKGPPSETQVDNLWVARIDVTADASDALGIAWSVVDEPLPTTTTAAGGSTSTTGAGGSSTSTTEPAGGSTSTTGTGATSSTTGSSSTSSTLVAGGSPSTGSFGGGSLPATGSSPVALVLWGLLLLTCGRLAYVLSRPPRVPAGRT